MDQVPRSCDVKNWRLHKRRHRWW